jgi:Uncharacterized protein conserved in bacteria (DUF2125)
MMRRNYWLVVVGIAFLLVAGEAIYWRITAERLRTGYQAWQATQVARGWDVESGPLSVGGWPRSAGLIVPNLTLRHVGPTIPGDINVASADVMLSVSLLDPADLHLFLTGPMHVRIGELPDVIVTGEETSASAPLKPDAPLLIALHSAGVRLEAATGAWHVTVGLLNMRVEIAANSSAAGSKPAATFALAAEAIALPAGIKWPLGPNISSLSADGRLNGPLPETRDAARWAEAWRNGGGSLKLAHLTMGWGPLGLTSSANLALDDQLQPMGSGNAQVIGYAETLDRLAAGGMLTKSAAIAAKALLSLMAGTSDRDEQPSVDVPLTLQSRTLSMGQVPLVRLPELDWPGR